MNFYRFVYIYILSACFSFSQVSALPSLPAGLFIKNLPDSSKVMINNSIAQSGDSGRYEIRSGNSSVQIEFKGVIVFTSSFKMKTGEEKTIVFNCREHCATLDVITEPFGASVYLNGDFEGETPYVNSFVPAGDYSLKVDLAGYNPVIRDISISENRPAMMTLNLEHSQMYRDSISYSKRKHKQSRQFIQKLLFSGLALACGAGGVYFDADAKSKLSQADDAAQAYDKARGNFQSYRDEYNSNRDSAKKYLGNRDLLYVAAGACAIGFSFSFFF
jgi:hypothetical protein